LLLVLTVAEDGFGGAAAIGTTPPGFAFTIGGKLVGVLPAVDPSCTESWAEGGDSESFTLCAFADVGVVTGVCWMEFFRVAFFDARVDALPTGMEFPLPLFRFLMTSVFNESGRTTP
jgi:hypothetical protein